MQTSESITKIAPALLKAQKAMGGKVEKGSANPFFKSKYADLNSVLEATIPHFNEAGITVLQPTVVVDNKNYVQTILMHESGEFIASLTEIKVSKVNDPQAEGSGISYARRYGLQSFANLAAVDDDGEAGAGRGTVQSAPKVEAKPSVVEQMKAAQTNPPAKRTTKFVAAKKDTPKVEASDELDL